MGGCHQFCSVLIFSFETDKKAANIVCPLACERIMAPFLFTTLAGLIALRLPFKHTCFGTFFFSVFSFEKIFWKGRGIENYVKLKNFKSWKLQED